MASTLAAFRVGLDKALLKASGDVPWRRHCVAEVGTQAEWARTHHGSWL
jgi:hypothetical protein